MIVEQKTDWRWMNWCRRFGNIRWFVQNCPAETLASIICVISKLTTSSLGTSQKHRGNQQSLQSLFNGRNVDADFVQRVEDQEKLWFRGIRILLVDSDSLWARIQDMRIILKQPSRFKTSSIVCREVVPSILGRPVPNLVSCCSL